MVSCWACSSMGALKEKEWSLGGWLSVDGLKAECCFRIGDAAEKVFAMCEVCYRVWQNCESHSGVGHCMYMTQNGSRPVGAPITRYAPVSSSAVFLLSRSMVPLVAGVGRDPPSQKGTYCSCRKQTMVHHMANGLSRQSRRIITAQRVVGQTVPSRCGWHATTWLQKTFVPCQTAWTVRRAPAIPQSADRSSHRVVYH